MSIIRSLTRTLSRPLTRSLNGDSAGGGAPGVALSEGTWEVSYNSTAVTVAANDSSASGVPYGLSASVSGGVLTVTGVPT